MLSTVPVFPAVEVGLVGFAGPSKPSPCQPGRWRAALVALAGCAGVGPVSSPARPSAVTSAVTSQPSGGGAARSATSGATSAVVPRPVHTVVVVMENHSYADIIGNSAAPFINQLARRGALFTRSYAVTDPSEPNYLALFSGSTQAVPDDSCPLDLHRAEPGRQGLIAAGIELRRLLRGPARGRVASVHAGKLRAQARALDRFQQRPRLGQQAIHQLAGR